MEASVDEPGRPSATLTSRDVAFELCELARSLVAADDANALAALELAARAGGADAALYVSVIPDDQQRWYRSIAALDPDWSARALRHLYSNRCTWLSHAVRSSEPILVGPGLDDGGEVIGGDDTDTNPHRAIWLIPAPPPRGSDVLGILMLAGKDEHQLDCTSRLMPVYRALALGLADWFQRQGRDELVKRANLTDRDLDLLRRQSLGQGSKRIASALGAEPKTIDCRFHRLNVRLGVASRRDAVRLCQRYGLL